MLSVNDFSLDEYNIEYDEIVNNVKNELLFTFHVLYCAIEKNKGHLGICTSEVWTLTFFLTERNQECIAWLKDTTNHAASESCHIYL